MINPTIQNLRLAIAPCCGLGANESQVRHAVNQVEETLSNRGRMVVALLDMCSELSTWATTKAKPDEELLGVIMPKLNMLAKGIRITLEKEYSNDALQETRTNLHSEALWSPALAQTEKTSQDIADHLMTLKRYRSVLLKLVDGCAHRLGETSWPWDYEASQKAIERRVVAAVKARNFQKAQRLDNYKAALCVVQTKGLGE